MATIDGRRRSLAGRARGRSTWLLTGLFVLLAAGCGWGRDVVVAEPGDLGHVHNLVLDDDGSLLVAAHTGLYRIDGIERAVLIGSGRHDLMAMTRLPEGQLVASGHPDLRAEEYRVEGLPPHLGLIESTDLGKSWTVIGGLGEADFHALTPTSDGIYAAEAGGSVWLLDPSGQWEERGSIEARDLAVSPENPQRQIATDFDGGLWASTDGARTWFELDGPSLIEVEWPTSNQLYGIDQAGMVWSTTDHAGEWVELNPGPVGTETFFIHGFGSWWVASEGGSIARSDNLGADWVDVYRPPGQ